MSPPLAVPNMSTQSSKFRTVVTCDLVLTSMYTNVPAGVNNLHRGPEKRATFISYDKLSK